MTARRLALALALAAATLFAAPSAQAFDYLHTPTGAKAWRAEREIVFHLSTQIPSDLSLDEVRAAAQHAAQVWSEASGLVLRIEEGVADAQAGCNAGDVDSNDIVFVEQGWDRQAGAVAETPVCMGKDSGKIVGADILLNAADFHFAALPADHAKGGRDFDLASVLVHEMGHALGMGHSEVKDAAMFGGGERGDVSKRLLAEDDVVGVQALYASAAEAESGAVGCSSAGSGLGLFGLFGLLALLARRRG